MVIDRKNIFTTRYSDSVRNQTNLVDVLRQYMASKKRCEVISITEAARTISLVVPASNIPQNEFDNLIALVAAEYGLTVHFDRCSQN